MKKSILILTIPFLICQYAKADTVRTEDGVSCTFDTNNNPWEISASAQRVGNDNDYGSGYSDHPPPNSWGYNNYDQNQYGVSVTYKFGTPKQLDCNKLYQMALKEKELKNKLLETKVNLLKKSKDIKWDE